MVNIVKGFGNRETTGSPENTETTGTSEDGAISRRKFLRIFTALGASLAVPALTSCATGGRSRSLEEKSREIDRMLQIPSISKYKGAEQQRIKGLLKELYLRLDDPILEEFFPEILAMAPAESSLDSDPRKALESWYKAPLSALPEHTYETWLRRLSGDRLSLFKTLGLWQINYEKNIIPELEAHPEKYKAEYPEVYNVNDDKPNHRKLIAFMTNNVNGTDEDFLKASKLLLTVFYKPIAEELKDRDTKHDDNHLSFAAEHHERLCTYGVVIQDIMRKFLQEKYGEKNKRAKNFASDGKLGPGTFTALVEFIEKEHPDDKEELIYEARRIANKGSVGRAKSAVKRLFSSEWKKTFQALSRAPKYTTYDELSESDLYDKVIDWGRDHMGRDIKKGRGKTPERGVIRTYLDKIEYFRGTKTWKEIEVLRKQRKEQRADLSSFLGEDIIQNT